MADPRAQAEPTRLSDGLWQFTAPHPEWTEGEDWGQIVSWWALAVPGGVALVDPLVTDWASVDGLVTEHVACPLIIRTCHWHQRSIAEAAARYRASVAALAPSAGAPGPPFDHAVITGEPLLGGVGPTALQRDDEIALWLPAQSALLFGDAMVRTEQGELQMCPASWTQPPGGRAVLRELLGDLRHNEPQHVLVSHGPLVLDDGSAALGRALS